ncbi:MAG: MFS transporter [Proteobacteria bacterium]|nr:MFS transporter [Pseudomonadota bacterium]
MSSRRALDGLNFLLADVKGCLGPYLGVYLLTEQHWTQGAIGLVATVGGLVVLAIQAPLGAVIDATHRKRGLMVAGLAAVAASAVAIAALPVFPMVLAAATAMAAAGAVFGPTVTAITLGVLGKHGLARRLGRNAAFDHAGNVFIAVLAGLVGWCLSQRAVFCLVPLFAVLAAIAVLTIPAAAIDHARARGLDRDADRGAERLSGWRVLLGSRPLLVFAGCVALFHIANAPMLPLVGQKLALLHNGQETALMSACIVAAQLVMLPMALLVGAKADRWGRKPIFLAAFAVLPIRGVLYTLSDDRAWLIAVQLLDGVGAGIFGTLAPLVLADLTRGTGRYNVSHGAVATVQGIAAALSNTAAGFLVMAAGYSAAFLGLAAVALLALLVFAAAMPETAARSSRAAPPPVTASRLERPRWT